jgi:hypothetical protein
MATIVERIRAFLRGPQAQRLIRQARDQLSKPDNKRRLRQIVQRLRRPR